MAPKGFGYRWKAPVKYHLLPHLWSILLAAVRQGAQERIVLHQELSGRTNPKLPSQKLDIVGILDCKPLLVSFLRAQPQEQGHDRFVQRIAGIQLMQQLRRGGSVAKRKQQFGQSLDERGVPLGQAFRLVDRLYVRFAAEQIARIQPFDVERFLHVDRFDAPQLPRPPLEFLVIDNGALQFQRVAVVFRADSVPQP